MPFDSETYVPSDLPAQAMPEGHRRLLKLASFLETVPDEKLDLSTWALGENCGASGCALGWACMIPEFRALGLHLNGALLPAYAQYNSGAQHLPSYAAAAFFDIPRAVAFNLFVGSEKVGKEARDHVVSRIHAYVARLT